MSTISLRSLILGCLGLVIVLLICSGGGLLAAGVSTYNSLQRTENALTTEYLNMSQSLTDYYAKTKGSLGIADRNAGQLQAIFNTAMNGGAASANFRDPNNSIYMRIQAAYPQIGSLNAYDKVQNILVASYDDYSSATKLLRDHVRAYRSSIGSFPTILIANFLGFPSNRLEVTVNGQTLYGAVALRQMEKVISDASASTSMNSGTLEPIFPTPTIAH